jgi:hypothetical protein
MSHWASQMFGAHPRKRLILGVVRLESHKHCHQEGKCKVTVSMHDGLWV